MRSAPPRGHPDAGLVPGVADVVAQLGLGIDVVVARRHGHLAGARQGPRPPALAPAGPRGVEGEAPEAVECLALARRRVLGSQHADTVRSRSWPMRTPCSRSATSASRAWT